MRVLRWIEALSGILAGVAGGAAISYLLLAPTYNSENCHIATPGEPPICVTSTATLPQVNGITAIVDLSIVAALLLGLAVPPCGTAGQAGMAHSGHYGAAPRRSPPSPFWPSSASVHCCYQVSHSPLLPASARSSGP